MKAAEWRIIRELEYRITEKLKARAKNQDKESNKLWKKWRDKENPTREYDGIKSSEYNVRASELYDALTIIYETTRELRNDLKL